MRPQSEFVLALSGGCMKWSTRASLAVAFGCAAAPAFAQTFRFEGEATWWWEASVDGGATWSQSLIEVSQQQTSVRIRANCSFPAVNGYYLGSAIIDQRVTGVNGAGPNDNLSLISAGIMSVQTFAVSRFANVLKIDDAADTLPPGVGSSHIYIGQPNPSMGPYTLANPINGLVVFDLLLDGTSGDRHVDAWWRDWTPFFPQVPPGPQVFIWNRSLMDPDRIVPALTVNDLTIRVIPAPGVVALLGAACAFAGVRRRRAESPRA